MLESLDAQCQTSSGLRWTFQTVITKADKLVHLEDSAQLVAKLSKDVHDIAPTCLPAIITTTRQHVIGISDVRRSIIEACMLKVE